jgi:hypothetical protein
MPWHDATKAAHILGVLARLIEGSEFEARIAELERALDERDAAAGINGHRPPARVVQ